MTKPDDPEATKCIDELLDAMDSYIPLPERAVDKPFIMPIEDIFSISAACFDNATAPIVSEVLFNVCTAI